MHMNPHIIAQTLNIFLVKKKKMEATMESSIGLSVKKTQFHRIPIIQYAKLQASKRVKLSLKFKKEKEKYFIQREYTGTIIVPERDKLLINLSWRKNGHPDTRLV